MYLLLGLVRCEALHTTAFGEAQTADYAEHALLSGKPRLQAVGEGLTQLQLALRLHHALGAVEARWQSLLTAKRSMAALPLIWGLGRYQGNFVITALESQTVFSDSRGNVLCREVSATLREWTGEMWPRPQGEAVAVGGAMPLGAFAPDAAPLMEGARAGLARVLSVFARGLRALDALNTALALSGNNGSGGGAPRDDAFAAAAQALAAFSQVAAEAGSHENAQAFSWAPAAGVGIDTGFALEAAHMAEDAGRVCEWIRLGMPPGDAQAAAALRDLDASRARLAPAQARMQALVVLREEV